jgi:hypothetical protein
MNKHIKLSILLSGMLLVAGCGSDSKTTRVTTPSQQSFKTLAGENENSESSENNQTVNHAPKACSKKYCIYNDTNLTGQLVASDEDNDTLTYSVSDLNTSKGTVEVNSTTGVFNYIPNGDFVGNYTFTFTVTDEHNETDSANVSITVKDRETKTVEVPNAPQNLTASDVQTTSVKLTWDDVEGETGYAIYQNGKAIKCVTANTTSFVVEGLEEGTDYKFVVRAKNDAGCSEPSDEVNVTTTQSTSAPHAPTGLEVIAKNKTCVRLKWVDNSNNESGFKIYKDGELVKTVPANSTCTTVSGLTKNTEYKFEIVATNSVGDSATSEVTVTTDDGANEAPVAYDRTYSTYKDTNLTAKLCAYDADGDSLEYEVKTGPEHGSVEINATSGEFVYSPENNYTGEDAFTFTVSDETNSSEEKTATIKICDK